MKNLVLFIAAIMICLIAGAKGIDFKKQSQQEGSLEVTIDGWNNDSIVVISYIWGREDENVEFVPAENGKIKLLTKHGEVREVIIYV